MTLSLPGGYLARPATMDDAAAALKLFNDCEIAETGEPDYDLDEVIADWSGHENLAATVELVQAPDGSLAGSMTLTDREHVVVEADGYVHPDHTGRGIGSYLVRRSEERAAPHIPLAPPGEKVVLRNYVNAFNPAALALLDGLGYRAVRHFWRMSITHDAPPDPPVLPPGFAITGSVAGKDDACVYAVVEEAFRDHWSMGPDSYADWLKRNTGDGYDPTLWFQLHDRATNEIAAAAVCRLYGETGWVRYLGVRPAWRRRGLGEALLRHAFAEFGRRGNATVQLGVDAENPSGALRLYERAGMSIVRKHVTYEKVLRDGEDWTNRP